MVMWKLQLKKNCIKIWSNKNKYFEMFWYIIILLSTIILFIVILVMIYELLSYYKKHIKSIKQNNIKLNVNVIVIITFILKSMWEWHITKPF